MKQYLVFDVYDNGRNGILMNYKDLRNLYIEELKQDSFDNYSEKEVVVSNIKELVNLAQSDNLPRFDDLENYLESFGWKIINLLQTKNDLESVKHYFLDNNEYVGNICEAINNINEVIKND